MFLRRNLNITCVGVFFKSIKFNLDPLIKKTILSQFILTIFLIQL